LAKIYYANTFESGQLANTAIFQPIEFNSDIILKDLGSWFIIFGDPVLTDLTMKLHANEQSDNTPGELIASSTTTFTKAQLLTLDNAIKYAGFRFNDVPIQADTNYHIVMAGTGYTPTANSGVAWIHGISIERHVYKQLSTFYKTTNIMLSPYIITVNGGSY